MSFEPTPLFYVIVGAMIGMVIGWAIGFFDSNTRTSKKIEAAEAAAEMKIAQAEQKLALVSQPSQTQQDDPCLLRLKKNDGRFMLEMDGALIRGELSPDKRKRLIELITVFRPWLEGGQTQQPTPAQSAPRQVVPQPAAFPQPAPQQVVPQPAELPSDSTPLEPVSAQSAVISPVQPSLQSLFVSKKPVEAEKNILALSMVQQIDTVLQARLVGTPLAKQGIRLQDSIQGGVEVYVGGQKFLAVDDVPDETIKAAIRAAIAEWEKKYTPGL
jgi:hypothetical protein